MSYEPPRRCRIDLFTPAEKAIYDAVQAVEAVGADVRLTKAVILLGQARDLVADYVDGVPDGEGYPRPAPKLSAPRRCPGYVDTIGRGSQMRCSHLEGHDGPHEVLPTGGEDR